MQAIAADAKGLRVEMIVTTEKDAVKLNTFSELFTDLKILKIGLRLDPDEGLFFDTLLKRLKR